MAGVRLERDGRVAVLTLHRPDRLNALSADLLEELSAVLEVLADDEGVGSVVLAGDGRAFSAGADIAEVADLSDGRAFAAWVGRLEAVCTGLERIPQPTIAAVHGVAFGGGFELALACDVRVASADARFGLPEIRLGLLPAAGGTQRLPRAVGPCAALHLLLTGDALSAEDAWRLGLVAQVVPAEEVAATARALATRLADGPRAAMATAKRLVRAGATMELPDAVALERREVAGLFDSADRAEGVVAFLAKRAPRFGA